MSDLIRVTDSDNWRWYAESEEKFAEGKCWIGVSAVLDVAQHMRLKDWFKNNSKTYIESHSKKTADIGTAIHALIENDLRGVDQSIPQEYKEPFDEWLKLKEQYGISATATEQSVYSNRYGYAGTFDILGLFEDKLCVMDIKTGTYSIKTGWQLAAYKYAYEEQTPGALGMVGLSVKRDGSPGKPFTYEHYEFCMTTFLSCLQIFKGLYYNKLKKMNWYFLDKPTVQMIS